MTRMMNAVEHLLLGAFVLELLNNSPAALSNIAFIIDGPLALFGEPAKLHQRLMSLIHEANIKNVNTGLRANSNNGASENRQCDGSCTIVGKVSSKWCY
jgi:hypothetical protein